MSQLRLIPAPRCEPPYDDEIEPHLQIVPGPAQQFLPLVLTTAPRPDWLHVVPVQRQPDEEDDFAAQRTSTSSLPPLKRWIARYAQAVAEVLAGSRSPRQLAPYTSDAVYVGVERSARIATRQKTRLAAAVVRSVRVCELEDGVAEASVVVRRGQRHRALALRVEGLDGRWCCTALHLG